MQPKKKTAFYLIDTSHAFYKPLGVRLAIVATVVAWTVLELIYSDMFWVVIAGALAAYTVNVLLISYKPPVDAPPLPPVADEDEDSGNTENDDAGTDKVNDEQARDR